MPQQPIINVHTHIFTDKHIPKYLAKTYVPWPLYWLIPFTLIFKLIKKWKNFIRNFWKPLIHQQTKLINWVRSNRVTKYLGWFISFIFSLNLIIYLLEFANPDPASVLGQILHWILIGPISFLVMYKLAWSVLLPIIIFLLLLYPATIKFLWQLARKIISPLQFLPTSNSLAFLKRYFHIAEFTKYADQSKIFDRLVKMYPPGSLFVVLPMDMQFMDAGPIEENYIEQLRKIEDKKIKSKTYSHQLIPFLFIDPRRIKKDFREKGQEKPFFKWHLNQPSNEFILDDCLFKDYFEGVNDMDGNFKGIKLYPALGYYPFDEQLLPIYYYCSKNDIPILTHCVVGTIFYRGFMDQDWMNHPVFKDGKDKPLATPAKNNFELQINFTHPLNYLVLLEDYYFMELLDQCSDNIQQLFGFDAVQRTVRHSLRNLKINLAHYGGQEEWTKYLEADRSDASVELIERPNYGLEMVKTQADKYSKPASLWSNGDEWFSIISSLMIQYPNVYADISYILHERDIMPTLKYFLDTNPKIASKVLFGTDFFVVRNHKSEKELLVDTIEQLGWKNFDLIAKENPKHYLESHFLKDLVL